MKVWISPYRDHWISPYTIIKRVCFWRVLNKDSDGDAWMDEPWADRWSDRLEPWCRRWQRFMDWIHPPIRYVKIDKYDTWSMDHTLAYIILPMLKQLKATKHGSPITDLEDVPAHLHPAVAPSAANNYDDDSVHVRWEWVMDEMIWAFEQELTDDEEASFFNHDNVDRSANMQTQIGQIKMDAEGLKAHHERKQNAFRLFGKYYQGLWD